MTSVVAPCLSLTHSLAVPYVLTVTDRKPGHISGEAT